jgi:hypothetical protein
MPGGFELAAIIKLSSAGHGMSIASEEGIKAVFGCVMCLMKRGHGAVFAPSISDGRVGADHVALDWAFPNSHLGRGRMVPESCKAG